jgi:hypothetical protein
LRIRVRKQSTIVGGGKSWNSLFAPFLSHLQSASLHFSRLRGWQLKTLIFITLLRPVLENSKTAEKSEPVSPAAAPVPTNAPPPQPPYTDFRFEQPGKTRKITPQELPAPYASDTSNNGPKLLTRPDNAWPIAPAGFAVQLYATALDNPRLIRTAPNGDFFLAESSAASRGTVKPS